METEKLSTHTTEKGIMIVQYMIDRETRPYNFMNT